MEQNSIDEGLPQPDSGEHIRRTFQKWQDTVGDKISKEDEERVLGIREAVEKGDKERAVVHLTKAKEESSWLYEELMKHPEISAIMRELSIMGL